MAELRLVVLHHHLLPGGVTSVIRDSLAALARHGAWDSIEVQLLVGSRSAVKTFLRQLKALAPGRVKAEVEFSPALAYRSERWPSRSRFEADVEQLTDQIQQVCRRHRAQLLWAHNPTLGKNPALTASLARLIQQRPDLRVLFHLHDFAECGRFANLAALRRCYPGGGLEEIYPTAPALTLVTLTETARRRLIQAGYPEAAVATLPNPVILPPGVVPLSRQERDEADEALVGWSRRQGFSFATGKKWLLAPVRTIRRKNLLETVFLKQLLGDDWSLLITLDCNSAPERPYAGFVKECLRQEAAQASLGFSAAPPGERLPFERLYASADAVAATAILEGFGLVFAESTLLGRPLVGRDLPEVTREMKGLPHANLYGSLQVPLKTHEGKRLLELYRQKIARSAERAGVGEDVRERAINALEVLLTGERVDFSYLDLPAQARAVHALRDPGYRGEIEKLNPTLEAFQGTPPAAPSEDEKQAMADSVGPEAFTRQFRRILEQPPGARDSEASEVSKRLCEVYFQPDFLRLLLDTGNPWRLWDRELIPRFVQAGGAASKAKSAGRLASQGTRVVLWDVYGTLLVPSVGDLEERLRVKEAPAPFFEALGAAGFDTSEPAVEPASLFRALIEADHTRSRRLGLRQPEVIIETIWQRLIEQVLPEQWATLEQARFAAAHYELATNRIALRPGVDTVIETLARQGYAQGILSNSQFYTPPVLKYALGPNAWAALEPALLFWSYRMGAAKPDPAPFVQAEAVLRSRGTKPEQIYLVGDSPGNDIAPARARGWKTILLQEDSGTIATGKEEDSAEGISPDRSCRSPVEILDWLLDERQNKRDER